jgi:diketogulonate reductase-like aldo/keto reductase
MAPTIELHSLNDTVAIGDGVRMPRLGVGTYKAAEGYEAYDEVSWALELGYRGIDTAALYGNEEDVGRAVRDSGIPRDELFVATKVWNDDQGYEQTLKAFSESLGRLAMDHVDLYLIHWPIPSLMEGTWRAMQEMLWAGRTRAIGVCNFLQHHLEQLASFADVPPAVDQVEFNPQLQQPELMWYLHDQGIVQQAWAPVMRGRVFNEPLLVRIAEKHGKTPAQVSIRWILQLGITTIPKSVHRARLAENAGVFDFHLSDEEMAAIAGLDRSERLGPDPRRYDGK